MRHNTRYNYSNQPPQSLCSTECFLDEIRSKRRYGEKGNNIFVKNLYTIEKRERIVKMKAFTRLKEKQKDVKYSTKKKSWVVRTHTYGLITDN